MTLYRPVGSQELRLIVEAEFAAFPPRLPHQPIFYPVLHLEYARTIACDWNTQDPASGYAGFVTRFLPHESEKRRGRAELAEEYEQDRRFLLELWAILEPILQADALHNAALAPDEATAERLRQMAEVPFFDLLRRGLENVEGQGSRASRTGIRLGLRDSLESSRDFTPEEVRAADERMTAAGLPTLTAMRHRIWRTIPKAIARGRCRNETEYYPLKERVIDMGGETLNPADRETLGRIVGEFEDRRANKKPRR